MDSRDITPLVLTYNEQPNPEATLQRLKWADRVVVLDSFSTDSTLDIAKSFKNVSVVQRAFDNHTSQWNFGLEQISTPWVLTLDADYHCSPELEAELLALQPTFDAYAISFRFVVFGKQLRGSIYPPRISLFRCGQFQYQSDGHTQALKVGSGVSVGSLSGRFLHDDRKPTDRWIRSQCKYADLELQKLMCAEPGALGWKDRLRSWVVFAPVLTLVYCLIVKRLIFDGRAGVYYTLQRVIAEAILSLKIVDYRLRH